MMCKCAINDADGDGYANVSPLLTDLDAMGAPTPEEAMEDSDADNSGGVSWDEFVTEWKMMRTKAPTKI